MKRNRSSTSQPIISKITRIKKEDDFCSNIAVIPQFSQTCWFNAILMAAFYSQQSRLLIKFTSKSWTPETITDSKKYKLLMIFKSIVFKYYKDSNAYINLYSKIKPETILLYLLQLNKTKKQLTDLIAKIKNNEGFGWHSFYIHDFYKFMDIKCLDIITIDNKVYYNLKNDLLYKKTKNPTTKIKALIDNNPDVLCIFKHDYFKEVIIKNVDKYNSYLSTNFSYENDFNINDVKDEITFNGYKYKLDSCLLSNHNKDIGGHAVAGITCQNTRYVYNGWNINTNDKGINKTITNQNPCSLFKYDWNSKSITEDFCFNTKECKLSSEIKPEDLCFSFNKGNKIYVYVKTVSSSSRNSSKIDTKNKFELSKVNITSAVKNVYSLDKIDTKGQLLLKLEQIYNSMNTLNKNSLKIDFKLLQLNKLSITQLKLIYIDYIKSIYKLTYQQTNLYTLKLNFIKKRILNIQTKITKLIQDIHIYNDTYNSNDSNDELYAYIYDILLNTNVLKPIENVIYDDVDINVSLQNIKEIISVDIYENITTAIAEQKSNKKSHDTTIIATIYNSCVDIFNDINATQLEFNYDERML